MKIRFGHVSNSSSASFWIPAFLLTDEEKEMILSLDDSKKEKALAQERLGGDKYNWETSKNNYPRNEEFHKIYEEMDEKKEWYDSWETGETDQGIVKGSTLMDNGSLKLLMERMGIDLGIVEWHQELGVERAAHPEAVQFFINKHHDWYDNLTEKDFEFYENTMGEKLTRTSIYEMTEQEFKEFEDRDYE